MINSQGEVAGTEIAIGMARATKAPTTVTDAVLREGTMNRNSVSAIIVIAVVSFLTLSTYASAESTRLFSVWQPHKSSSDELLRSAAYDGNLVEIRRLLSQGTPVDARDKEGWTPLIWAQAGDRPDAIALLLERGADINAKDRMGCTALHQAAIAGRVEAMNVLLERGADVEAVNRTGYTALMDASHYGRTVAVELLLAHGADPNAVNVQGNTAASLAEAQGHRNVALLLIANGADPYLQSKRLQSAISGMSSRSKGPARVRMVGLMRNTQVLEDLCERCRAQQSDSRVKFVSDDRSADLNAKLADWCRQSGLGLGKDSQEGRRQVARDRSEATQIYASGTRNRSDSSYLLQEAIETWEQLQTKYPDAEKRLRELSRKGISPESLTAKEPLLKRAMGIWLSLKNEHPDLAAQLMNMAGLGH